MAKKAKWKLQTPGTSGDTAGLTEFDEFHYHEYAFALYDFNEKASRKQWLPFITEFIQNYANDPGLKDVPRGPLKKSGTVTGAALSAGMFFFTVVVTVITL